MNAVMLNYFKKPAAAVWPKAVTELKLGNFGGFSAQNIPAEKKVFESRSFCVDNC
jgi:hypothetical protein